jgi:hypothetical protein
MSFMALKSNWGRSKRSAILAAMGMISNIFPEKILHILAHTMMRKQRYYHFLECRYSRSEIENFMKQSGFEMIKSVPHDLYGSKGHAAGLMVDFPFLAARNSVNFKLNPIGAFISRTLNGISPWIACSSVLCVAKVLKR